MLRFKWLRYVAVGSAALGAPLVTILAEVTMIGKAKNYCVIQRAKPEESRI